MQIFTAVEYKCILNTLVKILKPHRTAKMSSERNSQTLWIGV